MTDRYGSRNNEICEIPPEVEYSTKTFKTVDINWQKEDYNLETFIEYKLARDLKTNKYTKIEFSLIEQPFFCHAHSIKNALGKIYIFNKKKNSYMTVTPPAAPPTEKWHTNKIPQQFDEKIYFAILKLLQNARDRGWKGDYIIVTYNMILEKAGLCHNNRNYLRVKDSLRRLRFTIYELFGCYYSGQKKMGNLNTSINLLQELTIVTLNDYYKMSEEEQPEYSGFFNHKKIKEVLKIKISEHIEDNIVNQAFLYFNVMELEKIKNSVQQKMFMMFVKWIGWENKNPNSEENAIIRTYNYMSSKMPLSWEKKNRGSSKRLIIKYGKDLEKKKLIKKFIELDAKRFKVIMFSKEEREQNLKDYIDECIQELEKQKQEEKNEKKREDIDRRIEFLKSVPNWIDIVNKKNAQRDDYLPKQTIDEEKTLETEDIQNIRKKKQANVIDVDHEVVSDAKPIVDKAPNQNSQQIQQLIQLIPQEHRPAAQNKHKQLIKLLTKYVNEKGVEYVKSCIGYTIQRDPVTFGAYLTVVLKDDLTKKSNNKAKVSPEIAEAKKVARACFGNPSNGCPGTLWSTFMNTPTRPCHWCKKHERSRLDYENQKRTEQQQSETVEVQQPVQEKPQLSEVEQIKQEMRQEMMQMIQQMEDRHKQEKLTLQEKIQQLKADKETVRQVYKSQQPQGQTKTNFNYSLHNFRSQQLKRSVKEQEPQPQPNEQQKPVHQDLTPEQQKIVQKWFLMQDDLKQNQVLKSSYNVYVQNLQVDTKRSTGTKIVLFTDDKYISERLLGGRVQVIPLIQEIAGKEGIKVEFRAS